MTELAKSLSSRLNLLDLPYDIRHLIYEHLFPPDPQLYIHAQSSGFTSITPNAPIPTSIFRVNRTLGHEASEYFYNRYLFNIIGTKRDCLMGYKPFMNTLEKHSRDGIRMDAFGNGWQSQTMCISLQASETKTKLAVLHSRRRGVPMDEAELQDELREIEKEREARRMLRSLKFLSDISGVFRDSTGRHHWQRLFQLETISLSAVLLSSVLILFFALALNSILSY